MLNSGRPLPFVTANEWRVHALGWILIRSTERELHGGVVTAELVAEVKSDNAVAATAANVISDRFAAIAADVTHSLLPTEALAFDGGCGAEALAVAATGWAS